MNTVERFSNRVENYVKYRPTYPPAIIEFLREEIGFNSSQTVADIGSGTGISTKLFLENDNVVFGVEPNREMRIAAESFLQNFPKFQSINGTSEKTNLSSNSIDIIVAAQAYHWFDSEKTAIEFRRILKKDGLIILIWNERELDSTDFLKDYEKFLLKYATDYQKVRHDLVTAEKLNTAFAGEFQRKTFQNSQIMGFEGLLGRMLSSSYMPSENASIFPVMQKELHRLFTKFEKNGRIELLYQTNVFYSKL